MHIFERLQARLELRRLEDKYVRRVNRNTFISDAQYVDGEYVYTSSSSRNNSPARSSTSRESSKSKSSSSSKSSSKSKSSSTSRWGRHGWHLKGPVANWGR